MRKVNYDTWVATDGLGRTLPTFEITGPKDENKKVGMFYFMWHDAENGEIYDHNKTYEEGGEEALWKVMAEGPLGYAHYWAEPYFGYYRADDPWVIRRHAKMLTAAGVDFIFFDTSNGLVYPKVYTAIFETYAQMRAEGNETPQIMFFNGDIPEFGKRNTMYLWENLYSKGLYKDLWFMWDGKPMMLGNFSEVPEEITNFFTTRASWAFNSWTGDGKNKWPWIADYPQTPGRDKDGNIEQVVVASGFHATLSMGRSFHKGKEPYSGEIFNFHNALAPYGLCYEEQWSTAHKINPPVVMITGWNEWWAGRWENSGEFVAGTYVSSTEAREDGLRTFKHHYVDNFNPEFSRDLEPMRGGFEDSYYYQTVSEIRKYKGTNPIPKSNGRKTIDIKGCSGQWESVLPEYYDTINDTDKRDFPSFGGKYQYVNETGRNDLNLAKVCRDDEYIYFYISTNGPLSAPEGENWMNLFISTDGSGWNGYKYLLNRRRENGKASMEIAHSGWDWEECGTCDIEIGENMLMLRVKKEDLGFYKDQVGFDFKWADNSTVTGDIMEFMDKGDTAPAARFNFRYIE